MADENLVPRVPPHSEEAEQSVIGSILIDHEAVGVAAENLKPELVMESFFRYLDCEMSQFALDICRMEVYGNNANNELIPPEAFGHNIL